MRVNDLPFTLDLSEKPGLFASAIENCPGLYECSLNGRAGHSPGKIAFIVNRQVRQAERQVRDRVLFRFDMIFDEISET